MIIQIGTEVDESRILWKYKETDEWKRADIDDLICAYENRPKGEWVEDEYHRSVCNNCGYIQDVFASDNYCPHCGAKMGGDTE